VLGNPEQWGERDKGRGGQTCLLLWKKSKTETTSRSEKKSLASREKRKGVLDAKRRRHEFKKKKKMPTSVRCARYANSQKTKKSAYPAQLSVGGEGRNKKEVEEEKRAIKPSASWPRSAKNAKGKKSVSPSRAHRTKKERGGGDTIST